MAPPWIGSTKQVWPGKDAVFRRRGPREDARALAWRREVEGAGGKAARKLQQLQNASNDVGLDDVGQHPAFASARAAQRAFSESAPEQVRPGDSVAPTSCFRIGCTTLIFTRCARTRRQPPQGQCRTSSPKLLYQPALRSRSAQVLASVE